MKASWIRWSATMLGILGAGAAHAQQVVIARASLDWLRSDVVGFVATNFADRILTGPMLEQARQRTLEQQITVLCGSVSPAYLNALAVLNGKSLPLKDRLGSNADGIRFPACLKLSLLNGKTASKQSSAPAALDTAAMQAISNHDTRMRLEVAAPISLNGAVKTVRAVVAEPVVLEPLPGVSAAVAAAQLNEVVAAFSPSTPAPAAAVPRATGHIVTAVADPTHSAQFPACPATGTHIDEKLIRSAYDWSLARRGLAKPNGSASIYVVDNGFFGTDRSGTYRPAFPVTLFSKWSQSGSVVGPLTNMPNVSYLPNNYSNEPYQSAPIRFTPTDDQAHGTHVAGLTLGGPAFQPDRDQLFLADPANPSIELSIINLGNGDRDLPPASETIILGLIGGSIEPHDVPIVNLSVEYQGGDARNTFEKLFDSLPQALFVVAAGNDSQPVDLVGAYPAAVAGRMNAIKVAAHDIAQPSNLAWFTNSGPGLVDIAAPGCGVVSWKNATDELALSGTSQATPLVVFAASLLTTLDRSLGPQQIKARLMASGQLLGGGEIRWNVASGSRLDIPAALLVYDDVVQRRIADASQPEGFRIETQVGEITDSFALRCETDPLDGADRPISNLWAIKRQGSDAFLITGRNAGAMQRCNLRSNAPNGSSMKPSVRFRQTGIVTDDAVIPIPPKPDAPPWIELESILSIIFHGAG